MSLKKYGALLLLMTASNSLGKPSFTVVLDAGTISESSLTQEAGNFLENLRQELEDTFPSIRVVLSRISAEATAPAQAASFSNRIGANLHTAFTFSLKKEGAKTIRTYSCLHDTDPIASTRTTQRLALVPASKAYQAKAQTSQMVAKEFVKVTKEQGPFTVQNPLTLPLKPLQSVAAPSFLVEIEMQKPKEWKHCFQQISEGIKATIHTLLEKETHL